MAFAVSEFKTNLKGGGARPSLFTVTLRSPPTLSNHINLPRSEFLVKAASIPTSTIAALPINYGGRAYKLNGFRPFDVWTTTIINDENFEARNKITNWMRFMSGHLDGTRSSLIGGMAEVHEGSATVTQLGTDAADKQTYKFYNLWPTELAEIPVDWSSDAIEEYTVTWCYDYWSHGSGTSTTDVVSASA